MFDSTMCALTTSISNVLGFGIKRAPELIIDGSLAVIRTVVDNKLEYVWGVDIAYPLKYRTSTTTSAYGLTMIAITRNYMIRRCTGCTR